MNSLSQFELSNSNPSIVSRSVLTAQHAQSYHHYNQRNSDRYPPDETGSPYPPRPSWDSNFHYYLEWLNQDIRHIFGQIRPRYSHVWPNNETRTHLHFLEPSYDEHDTGVGIFPAMSSHWGIRRIWTMIRVWIRRGVNRRRRRVERNTPIALMRGLNEGNVLRYLPLV